ncbi:hypothetical protein ACHWQZ_G000348 [Mnemiopsis leidyi]
MILAGFFTQLAIFRIISIDTGNIWTDSVVCTKVGIAWFLIFLISGGVAGITAWKSRTSIILHGTIAFVGSFFLNLTGSNLGYFAIGCSNLASPMSPKSYGYFTIAVMLAASIVIMIHFMAKEPPLTTEKIHDPDAELFLLGICIQFTVISCISVSPDGLLHFCQNRGLGSWAELAVVSAVLAGFNLKKNGFPRSLSTFFGSFVIHLSLGGVGGLAIVCSSSGEMKTDQLASMGKVYGYFTVILHILATLVFSLMFLNKNLGPVQQGQENPEATAQRHELIQPAPGNSYLMQESYSTQASHPKQASSLHKLPVS